MRRDLSLTGRLTCRMHGRGCVCFTETLNALNFLPLHNVLYYEDITLTHRLSPVFALCCCKYDFALTSSASEPDIHSLLGELIVDVAIVNPQ